MKKIEIRSILLALIVTAILSGLLSYYIRFKAPYTGQVETVIVASKNIPAKTKITEKMVKEQTIPSKIVIKGNIKEIDKVIGMVTKENIYEGEQILGNRIIHGRENYGLAAVIPTGYRGVTLNIDPISGVGWNVRVGDFVDILVYIKVSEKDEEKEVVKTIFQKVEVLDVVSDTKGSQNYGYITLCMKPEEAQQLFFADMAGKVRLTLRYVIDSEQVSLEATGIESIK